MNYTDTLVKNVLPYANQVVNYCSREPVAALVTAAAVTAGLAYLAIRATSQASTDAKTAQRLSREIIDLTPTIPDGDAYSFTKMHKKYVSEAKSKDSNICTLAAVLRSGGSTGSKAEITKEEFLKLGVDTIEKASGQCDHMAAAVIAKIVGHIKKGGRWNTDVEVMGNGGHAFVVMQRDKSRETHQGKSWKDAVVIDAWLGCAEPIDELQAVIQMKDGVVHKAKAFAQAFGASDKQITVTYSFSSEELHEFARNESIRLV